jgi:peroxiredoxin
MTFLASADNGDDSFELPLPATFIVATDGAIVHAFVNTDYQQSQDPEGMDDPWRDRTPGGLR